MARTSNRPPTEQWWSIRGDAIMEALEDVEAGTHPVIAYQALCDDSESHDYGTNGDL